jgi:tRNA threonylcarbamoyladenosine biosynthesis protein TsaB
MIVLGIETATVVCGAGLADERGVRAERSLRETHIHSEKLLTLVQEACESAGVKLSAIGAVAVSIGPGSFTGLRIGLSAAKGLCVALRCPLVPVPTFDAIAASAFEHEPAVNDLAVCLDARQGDFYLARYRRGDGAIERVSARALESVTWWDETPLILTDAVTAVRRVAQGGVRVDDVHPRCSAGSVALLGHRLFANGVTAPVATAEPLYLKDFVVKSPRPTA